MTWSHEEPYVAPPRERPETAGAHIRLIEGSDHGISDFDDHFPAVLAFLGLVPAR